jgi:diguanylate cyclase (GGDEF)-like protein
MRGARRDWLLEVGFPTLDSVEFFGPGGERLSARRPPSFRDAADPASQLRVPRALARVRRPARCGCASLSEGTLTVPLRLWRSDAFWQESMFGYAVLSVYFGMLLALALYNLLLWFSLRESVYLSYVLFATGMAVGQVSMNGLGNQFLWPAWPGFGETMRSRSALPRRACSAPCSCAQLSRHATQPAAPGRRHRRPCRPVRGLHAGAPGCAVSAGGDPDLADGGERFPWSRCWPACAAGAPGSPGARTFLLAWTVLLLGAAVFGLRNMDVLPTTFLSFYALQMGSALEMLLLSFALADRINGLRREKDAAQGEALAAKQELVAALKRSEAGLERRVGERTAELEALNARLRENERQLQALAHTDTLTGLANRLLLGARLEQSIQLARRSQGQIALLLVDVDRFKAINDTYGHAIGDEVLRVAAQRLRAAVRAVDTVARLGGDEFAVVLSGLSGAADAERMAEKIVIGVREPMRVLGMPLEISASVGVATYSGGELSPAELMRRADQAMYAAKSAGRDCFRVFSA